MYGWLSCNETHTPGEISVLVPNWDPIAALALTEAQRKARLGRLMPFVTVALAQDAGRVRDRLFFAVREIVQLAPEDFLEFAMHMCVAHERLPDAARAEREATIARIVDSNFSGITAPGEKLGRLLNITRQMAILIPDALMDTHLRSICALIRSEILGNPATQPPEYASVLGFIPELAHLCGLSGNPRHEPMCGQFVHLMLSRPTAQFGSLQQQIRQLTMSGLGEVVIETTDRLAAQPGLPTILGLDALARIIEDTLSQGRPPQWSEIIDPQLTAAWAMHDAQHNLALRASVAAVRAGVPMGSERTRQSQAALQTLEDSLRAVDQTMTPARVRTARLQRLKPTPGPSVPPADSVDAVQSWSVDRLVRWIEGPVTDASIRQAIDRRRIVAQDKESRQKSAPPRGPAPQAAALTEADVGGMIEDALSATARFFLDELNELLPMATALGADEKAAAVCAGCRESLARLAEQPSAMDEVKARNLLQNAEAATAALRASVKQARATALVEKRFALQLGAALGAEPLVMGKRHGGVVQCPVQPGDWSFVAANFHRRWLPRVKKIAVDGLSLPLDADQAVALYVTASSLSQYAFDVSVHLWRRRPGRSSLPSDGGGLYPPMNEQDWFDTYIPCCVLHVPQAH
ncbi:hypothetical protein [Hydrogenophaga sp.]|uniref:hypothetical protein n=1 Tax=Hydrogenophaga sp. TaxID=1904254 RepID=UPI002731BBE6|nr:hypothetical protein [Hydrogenophaga sp.]MDP1687390.1 hypothetical protein [Hydrogenophaga sp.]